MNLCFLFVITPTQQVQHETEHLEGSGKDYKKLSILLQLKTKEFSLQPFRIRSSQNIHGKSVNQLIVNSNTDTFLFLY